MPEVGGRRSWWMWMGGGKEWMRGSVKGRGRIRNWLKRTKLTCTHLRDLRHVPNKDVWSSCKESKALREEVFIELQHWACVSSQIIFFFT